MTGIRGVPALFFSELFFGLKELEGNKGARELIRNSPDAVTIPLPEAAIDVDMNVDLRRLNYSVRARIKTRPTHANPTE